MTPSALTLVTYVWHYLVARLLYDDLLRPLSHGHVAGLVVIAGIAGGAFLIGWRAGRARLGSRRRA